MSAAICDVCHGFGVVECDNDIRATEGKIVKPCQKCDGNKLLPECEVCEGTGRIEREPESVETVPCTDCIKEVV